MEIVELVRKDRLKTISRFWLGLLRYYFRIEIEGLENVPKKGGALIAPNHSGFVGADAVLLTFVLKRETKRRARLLAHRAYFDFSKTLKAISESHGLIKASVKSGAEALAKGRLVILFPEGETGSFKATARRYELQKFHTGFLRMALEAKTPLVPCLVMGAEESNLNFGNINIERLVKGLKIPLPINFIPLPAKWKIVLLPPVDLSQLNLEGTTEEEATKILKREALRIQKMMQTEINKRLKKREFIYSRGGRQILNKVESLTKDLRSKLKRPWA